VTFDHLESLRDDVDRQFKRASRNVSIETKQWANQKLTELTPRLHEVTREDAYEDYLLDSIQAEAEKFQLYTEFQDSDLGRQEFVADTYYDELRDRPVCTCDGKHGHKCPLKLRELPREIRRADDLDAGIREFRAGHRGRPIALLDAQQAFAAKVAHVEQELRTLLSVLSSDEIPADTDDAAVEAQ